MGKIRKVMWKCEHCEAEAHYKGLCRDCTEYDGEGSVLNPIYRVKVNDGETRKHNHLHDIPTPLLQGVRGYRTQRKPTKKQLKKLESELGSFAPHQDGQFNLIGESEEE